MGTPLSVKATATDGKTVVVNMASYVYMEPVEETGEDGTPRTITHIGMVGGDVLAVVETPEALANAAVQQQAQLVSIDEQTRLNVRGQVQANAVGLHLPTLGRA